MRVGEMMYPILISFGKFNIYTHGLLIAIGAVIGGFVMYYLAKKEGLNKNIVFDLIVYSLLGGLIGARILYVILYYHQLSGFREIFYIWYGGLVSFGGVAGGLLAAAFVIALKKEKILAWFDIGIIGLNLGWIFGRLGCLLAGDSFGIFSASKIAIWGRVPTQLFESFWSLIVAILCFIGLLYKKKYNLPNGLVFLIGIGFYAIGRFIIDFWRDENIYLWHLKAGQLGSVLVLVIALIFIGLLIRRQRGLHGI